MAILIPEPADSNPMTEDWQKLLYRTTIQGGGFMCFMLGNLNNAREPYVMKGSRFELNGSYYYVSETENIEAPDEGWHDFTQYYVYAIPQESSVFFKYSLKEPEYSPIFGGWFIGTKRAVARVYYVRDGWYDKMILDSIDAMFRHNVEIDSTYWEGGDLVFEGEVNLFSQCIILPGAYRIELQGGTGGKGGNGGARAAGGISYGNNKHPMVKGEGGIIPYFGYDSEQSVFIEMKDLNFSWKRTPPLRIGPVYVPGKNGTSASSFQAYTTTSSGGGGGGGVGGISSIALMRDEFEIHALGGKGGNGGDGRNNDDAGPVIEGENGYEGDFIAIPLLLKEQKELFLFKGADGNSGGNGKDGAIHTIYSSSSYTKQAGGGASTYKLLNESGGKASVYMMWGQGIRELKRSI